MVQTYRFFQTAAYRRERLKVARELADFNDQLLKTLERRLEANQVPAADVVLARVESRATRQLVKAAQQDYVTALTDLRNQIGIPESAGAAEPLGEFTLPPYIPPAKEEEFVDMALAVPARHPRRAGPDRRDQGRGVPGPGRPDPDPDRRPPVRDGRGGHPVHRLRLHHADPDLEQRRPPGPPARGRAPPGPPGPRAGPAACAGPRSARPWPSGTGPPSWSRRPSGLTAELAREVKNLERLFDQGQTDLGRLMQAQQRLIQLRTAEVDAIWAATQAQADLLLALGAPALIQGMLNQAEQAAGGPAPASAPASPPPASFPSPFRASPVTDGPSGSQPPRF